jgi:co-chaperonin GroES (HSP10)
MRALGMFIVRLPKKFKDTISIAGQEMYLASKFDEFGNRINYAEIVSTPARHEVGANPGDILYFHHHVCVEKSLHLEDDLYMVRYDPNGGYGSHAYAYETPSGEIHMLSDWVFVEQPQKVTEKIVEGIIILEEDKDADHGFIRYANKELAYLGAKVGDKVYFSQHSDYAMEVKGETLWRMRNDDLLYVRNA